MVRARMDTGKAIRRGFPKNARHANVPRMRATDVAIFGAFLARGRPYPA
jgi:hypothetical protein